MTQSNIQEKTNEVIQKSLAEGIQNPFCVGISENLLTYLGVQISYILPKTFPVPNVPDTEMKVYPIRGIPYRKGFVPSLFKIEADTSSIHMQVSVGIDFYDTKTPDVPFAQTTMIFKLITEPFLATANKNYLAMKINQARLDGNIEYPNVQEEEIIKRFESLDAFKQYVSRIAEQISDVHAGSDFDTLLPSVFSHLELPNTWRYAEGYEVRFQRFAYETGIVADEPSGFVFLVFSVHSLNLPPCNCLSGQQETGFDSEDLLLDDPIKEEDHWITVGLSQSSLQEIISPYSRFAQKAEVAFLTRSGPAFGEVTFWLQLRMGDLKIYPDGVGIKMGFETGGHVTAYVKDPVFGGKFGYEAAHIRLVVDEISARAIVRSRSNPERGAPSEIFIRPYVEITNPNLEIEGPLPYPISELAEMIIEKFLDTELDKIIHELNTKTSFTLFFSKVNTFGDFGFFLVGTDFYEDSSVVITGYGTND